MHKYKLVDITGKTNINVFNKDIKIMKLAMDGDISLVLLAAILLHFGRKNVTAKDLIHQMTDKDKLDISNYSEYNGKYFSVKEDVKAEPLSATDKQKLIKKLPFIFIKYKKPTTIYNFDNPKLCHQLNNYKKRYQNVFVYDKNIEDFIYICGGLKPNYCTKFYRNYLSKAEQEQYIENLESLFNLCDVPNLEASDINAYHLAINWIKKHICPSIPLTEDEIVALAKPEIKPFEVNIFDDEVIELPETITLTDDFMQALPNNWHRWTSKDKKHDRLYYNPDDDDCEEILEDCDDMTRYEVLHTPCYLPIKDNKINIAKGYMFPKIFHEDSVQEIIEYAQSSLETARRIQLAKQIAKKKKSFQSSTVGANK